MTRALRRYTNPFSIFDEMERDMARVFRGYEPVVVNQDYGFTPTTDVTENEKAYFVSVDLPGVKKENINVEVHEGILKISGERKSSTEREGYSERRYGKFERSLSLPKDVDADKIEAHFENGVLELAIPKKEALKPKSIQIGVGDKKPGLWDRLLGKDTVTQSDQQSA